LRKRHLLPWTPDTPFLKWHVQCEPWINKPQIV
jgi:hypothetical protein